MDINNQLFKKVINAYQINFADSPEVLISAPGRINLIGEHTDYSEGFVLPVAIDLEIIIALRRRADRMVNLFSIDLADHGTIDLDDLQKTAEGWLEYIKGVAWVLGNHGFDISGWQGVITGSIPIGAGLSSSAALETAAIKAFCHSSVINLSKLEIAKLGQEAEINWVGVNVGIMDQLISSAGKANNAVLLDCKTLEFEYVPIPANIRFIVLDTMTRRELTTSAYNRRHEEVIMAANILGVPTLRSASRTLLINNRAKMPPEVYLRARHVITENERVHSFCKAMQACDLTEMGQILNASHTSLREDFKVSSRELDCIVNLAQKHEVCYGARMMGAGFGGCALALIDDTDNSNFITNVHQAYHAETGIEPRLFSVESSDGVRIIQLSDLGSE